MLRPEVALEVFINTFHNKSQQRNQAHALGMTKGKLFLDLWF